MCPQSVPSKNAEWKVRNTLQEPREPFTMVDGGLRLLTVVCQKLEFLVRERIGGCQTTVNNRKRRAAIFSYRQRFPSWRGCFGDVR
jgi:hypothetical protein